MSADKPQPQTPPQRTLLVVDDDRVGRESLAEALAEMGYRALEASDGATALRLIETEAIDLVLTDLRMPDIDGIEVLKRIRRRDSSIFVILITAYATVHTAVEAMKLGAFNYIMKPIDLDQLRAHLENALNARDLLLENISLRQHLHSLGAFPELIGNSPAMKPVFDLIAQVADTHSAVLIRGESGTGKELVANAIHRRSSRATGPFIKVNCAALSESLLESELFGHEEGAFTGAIRQKLGRFELADGGSIFLDEVSDLAPTTQAKLLRVLQNFEFERLGGTQTISVDVRVIAATNADLEERVRGGKLRQDLYFRLNVVPVVIPPLRERREDIPLLVHTFIPRFAERNRKEVEDISPEALQVLMRYDWPGNVRELENCIERMVVTSPTRILDLDILPAEILPTQDQGAPSFRVGLTMAQIEERALRETLAATGGHRAKAARILGIGLRTLHRKIELYGIERIRRRQS
jgi:DNA-binding NtrC family response regulator